MTATEVDFLFLIESTQASDVSTFLYTVFIFVLILILGAFLSPRYAENSLGDDKSLSSHRQVRLMAKEACPCSSNVTLNVLLMPPVRSIIEDKKRPLEKFNTPETPLKPLNPTMLQSPNNSTRCLSQQTGTSC
ncbi:hypothetical protein TNCV_1315831 [Trichonephila clavipes]|uniref:Uncharacterized protein n=1 Tax=Trichonephila clavipes TaxID=2585209 RepID=A0A8X6VNL3_TRICX|nr:hypothetical protein TNCV_1315831 [Trichonephila clavipes]